MRWLHSKKKRAGKVGLPPGTLVHVGEQKVEQVTVSLVDYDEQQLTEKKVESIDEVVPYKEKPTTTWINVDGLHQLDTVEECGLLFDIHPLVLEDVVNTDHRPKIEDYGDYIFIVLKVLWWEEEQQGVAMDQLSVILGHNFVLTFQEHDRQVLAPVLKRLKQSKGRIRRMGAGYLAYALMDAVVDHYFYVIDALREQIEKLEEELLLDPKSQTLQQIHGLRRTVVALRKALWPLREATAELNRSDSTLLAEATRPFLRDLYDHTVQVVETVTTFRDTVAAMLDMYLSMVSYRMNEVMKVLTIIATIFIPLTFIAGIYGMNFKHMPELDSRWGYPTIWIVILVISVLMLMHFRRKRWL